MTDLPRLTVTQEQAADLIDGYHVLGKQGGTLRLPERPTKPCPNHIFYGHDCPRCGGSGTVHKAVPIPEGTRVEVGFIKDWNISEPRWQRRWHPVATATVAEVREDHANWPRQYRRGWLVTLADIDPVNDCDDGQPV